MNVTAWASGLEVTGDGTGIVSHAGVGLVRRLADKTGLTRGLSQALFSGRLVHHDRGRLTAAMIAQILLAWLKLLALDGDLAKAEPKTLRPVN